LPASIRNICAKKRFFYETAVIETDLFLMKIAGMLWIKRIHSIIKKIEIFKKKDGPDEMGRL